MTDWRALVGCCSRLMKYAIRLTRNRTDAEDLVQDTLEKAWRNREQFTHGDPMNWMAHIMFNQFRSDKRHKSVTCAPKLMPFDDMPAVRVECVNEAVQQIEDVDRFLSTLKPSVRQTYVFVRGEGYTAQEAAERLGILHATAKTHVSRVDGLLRREGVL